MSAAQTTSPPSGAGRRSSVGPNEIGGEVDTKGAVPRRVWSGTALLVGGRIFGSACTFAALWLLAGWLTPDAFGRYTFYLAVFALLDSLADLGTGQIAVQRTSNDPLAVLPVLAATRRIRLRAGLLGVALVGGGALAFDEPDAAWILLASLYPVTHVLELSATVYKNKISWRVPVAMRAFASALSLTFVLTLYAADVTRPALYLCAVAAGSTIANVGLHLAARRHLPPVLASERPPARGIFKAALPLGLAGLCAQAYFYVDNLFVRAIEGPAAVGVYNLGVRILGFSIMVALFASTAALPWFAREHAAGRLGSAIARLAQPLFTLAGLGAGVLFPWSAELLSLFGSEFAVGAASLRWLLVAVCVIYLGAALMTGVVATGKTGAVLAITASGLGLNLVGNTLLVPRLGIEGAAIATLATESLVVVGACAVLARIGNLPVGGWRTLLWLGGPLGFLAGSWLSSLLPLG